MPSCGQLAACQAIVQGTYFGCRGEFPILSQSMDEGEGRFCFSENKLICWFLPGVKTQANAKTEGTHKKAIILGGYSSCTHIIWVH